MDVWRNIEEILMVLCDFIWNERTLYDTRMFAFCYFLHGDQFYNFIFILSFAITFSFSFLTNKIGD